MERTALDAFIDASVKDQVLARRMLAANPELLNARRGLSETALHFLAVEGFVDGVRFLATCGAEIDPVNEFGHTPLLEAACLGELAVAQVLLDHGANPNAQSPTIANVLHNAARSGNADLVGLLVSRGARPDYVTDLGQTLADGIETKPEARAQMIAVLRRHGFVLR